MIVKITYSAELEEVPQEVSKVLISIKKESEELFRSLGSSSKELLEELDIDASIVKIEKSIKTLEKLSVKLKDSHSILVGYKKLVETPPQPEDRKTSKKE